MLKHLKRRGLADRIFVISPTIQSNKPYLDELGVTVQDSFDQPDNSALEAVMQAVDAEAAEWQQYETAAKVYKQLLKALRRRQPEDIDPELLMEASRLGVMDSIDALQPPKSKYGHKPVLHLWIDDCQGSQLMCAGPRSKLNNLCIRHRHCGNGLGLSIWLCVQNWSCQGGVPRPIRENTTAVCLFKIKQQKMLEQIADECSGQLDTDDFLAGYSYATSKPHGFLLIDFGTKDPDRKLRAGWNEFLPTPMLRRLLLLNQ